MNIKILIASTAAAIILSPAAALAQTPGTPADVQSLLSQIQALQQQLKSLLSMQGTTSVSIGGMGKQMLEWKTINPGEGGGMFTVSALNPGQMGKMTCMALKRNLKVGSQGEDVRKLQDLLAQDPTNGFTASSTGFFGPMTARAMMKFQMRMGIASSTDGSVGPLTRGFFERSCGAGQGNVTYSIGNMQGGFGTMAAESRAAFHGTITAADQTSITVQMKDGIFRTVFVSASTSIMVMNGTSTPPTTGTMADLVSGKDVMVEGKPNGTGGVNAIHIRVGVIPMGVMMFELKTGPGGQQGQGMMIQGWQVPPMNQ